MLVLLLARCFSASCILNEGDNLYDIAERYGTTVEDILKTNKIASEDLIKPGDSLLMPVTGKDVITIRMGNSIFNDDLRFAGSGFMAICWIGKINDAEKCAEIYESAVTAKAMRPDGWINDWDMKNVTKATKRDLKSGLYECKDGEREILECRSPSGSHYVVGNGKDEIEYDPMYDGYVSYTDCVAKHIYRFGEANQTNNIFDEL